MLVLRSPKSMVGSVFWVVEGGKGRKLGKRWDLRLTHVPVGWMVGLADVLKSHHRCSSSPFVFSSQRFVMLEPRTVHSQPPFGFESGKV